MNLSYSDEEWRDLVTQHYPIEFDWIGVDSLNQVGCFSSINCAWTPGKVFSSLEEYSQLANLINSLPEETGSLKYTKSKGQLDSWHSYSRRGLIAFDFQDIHRKHDEQLNQYDLMTLPHIPIYHYSIAGLSDFLHMIPRFNLVFDHDISFYELQKAEIKI